MALVKLTLAPSCRGTPTEVLYSSSIPSVEMIGGKVFCSTLLTSSTFLPLTATTANTAILLTDTTVGLLNCTSRTSLRFNFDPEIAVDEI
ncbi:hypothetical protein E2C01_023967 [Portunus trituberculatus]|uniref:Uncharacterized protein n=1 Tax=Portunus trituberculatus TaxID=210409 RepID=A0A5B7EAN4_PORTR|nr:hypothetical protein [Portunus trituberculatus]